MEALKRRLKNALGGTNQVSFPRHLFQELLEARLTPTVVTYNALISAHVRDLAGILEMC